MEQLVQFCYSRFLNRKPVHVAQDVNIFEYLCGTLGGIDVTAIVEGGEVIEELRDRIVGRVALLDIPDTLTGEIIVHANEEISEETSNQIQMAGHERVKIRSVLTCETKRGACAKCYGRNLATGMLVEFDPYNFAILTEAGGSVAFKDILDAVTVEERTDDVTGFSRQFIIDSPDEKKQPQILVKDSHGHVQKKYLLPSGAMLMVSDGQEVHSGDTLVKIPRETRKTKDITGGLPRVVELFEARRPKEPARITEIDGVVHYGEVAKQHRKIFVTGDDDQPREYQLPRGAHINVQEGEKVKAGEPLMDGPIDPHDILKVRGEKELQRYLVDEIQEVYRLQGVNINDKHIEVITRQMMRWVKVEDVGDTEFLIDEVVDKFRFMNENDRMSQAGKKSATGHPLLLGITKASLSTDSFISAASFQETTRVLTEAAISGKVDYLPGLKENVIMGRLIPAGTGMEFYRGIRIPEEG